MENQVLTIEQMQELQELGIDISKASMHWISDYYDNKSQKWIGHYLGIGYNCKLPYPKEKYIPAFTLYDILRLLPKILVFKDDHESNLILGDNALVYYETVTQMFCLEKRGKNILEAAFNMLKWLKENNYI